jgi:SPP1 family predicted phage head-tail adaptor
MKQPPAGSLTHKMQLQRAVDPTTDDPRGDEQPTFTNWKQVWVSIEPLMGRELQYAMQQHGSVSHKIKMRYTTGMNKRMRGIWNGRTFDFGPPLSEGESGFMFDAYATEI